MRAYGDLSGTTALVSANQAPQPAPCSYDVTLGAPSPTIVHYLAILRRHHWKILGAIIACVIATLTVSIRLTPVFESTVTVDIDRQMPSAVIGQDAVRPALNDGDQFLATQAKLIQSDSVLRPVVRQFRLAEDAPILLRNLKVSRPPNTYLLLISYRSPDARLSADVANAVANSYVGHTYDVRVRSSAALGRFMEKQLEELKAKMERSSAALAQFERELNVIDPEEKTSILSARLLQLNTEHTSAQADRVRKESAWDSVRSGTLAAAQASTQGESLKALSARLDEARQKFAEVQTHYGVNHPEYRKTAVQVEEIERQLQQSRANAAQRVEAEYREASAREAMLGKAVAETKAEFDRLNARGFEYQSLKREAAADKALYEELMRKIKEAGINAGFQNSSIRIADPARAAIRPVFPNVTLNVLLAFMFSTIAAISLAVVSDALDGSVREPEQVTALFQTAVVGCLPVVKTWRRRSSREPSRDAAGSGFEDAVGAARNLILLGANNRRIRSLMIASATAGEGKTTTAVHLAIAHARQRLRTLLIDCDLRCPGVHARLGLAQEPGLATVLQNGVRWRSNLVQPAGLPELDVLPAGKCNRSGDGLVGRGLPQILEEAVADYDLVIVDSPPLLGFPEPLPMAAAVDGVVLVAKAGKTDRKLIGSALTTLQRVRANVLGVVLNSVTSESLYAVRDSGSYQRHYAARAARAG